MWHTWRASAQDDPDLERTTTELAQLTLRHVVWATTGAYMLWHFLATITWPGTFGPTVWLTTLIVLASCGAALRLLSYHLPLAQIAWQVGLAIAITISLLSFGEPAVVFLYALLPSMAVITSGWLAGLLVEAGIVALLVGIGYGLPASSLPGGYAVGTIAAGGLAALLGWAPSHALYMVTHWSIYSLNQARENMEAAREHRAQLAKVVKDLDQAYFRLERTNASLVAAWRTAEEAERFKAEFVTNVSHELRTPLNLIVGFSEMMLTAPESYDGVQVPGPYRSDLNVIHHNAQHLLALVDDVLDLARIEVGRFSLLKEETDIPTLVTEAAGMVRDYIAAKGLALQIHLDPDLPRIWIDRLRIRQVLLNLLVNAARFTERGSITLEVRADGSDLLVRVSDTGRGIPEQDLPKIFEEFRSTDQPLSTWHSGTGLGLPISKRFVQLHHGRMGVESVYLQGTTFWFALPCAPANGYEDEGSALLRARRLPGTATTERIVVLVHDDPRIGPLLERHLEGYRIVGHPDLQGAAALARDLTALALVVDESVVADPLPAGIPVIRARLPSSRRVAAAMGADDLLVKPVTRAQLLGAIDRLGKPVRRVLIADDDPDVVRLFHRMLRTRVAKEDRLEAFNGEEALRLITGKHPDLVILDLVMPEKDGLAVLEHMASDPACADTAVILVTARGQDYSGLQVRGPIVVDREEPFQFVQFTRVLGGVLGSLAPAWQQPTRTTPEPAADPASAPASADSPPLPK
jgi:signal transduction histidine kinase/CheY-like chemotaxis protein